MDSVEKNDDFHIFTSLRYDTLLLKSEENSKPELNFVTPSPFYMLAYHRDRLVEAAQHFEFERVEKKLEDGCKFHEVLESAVQDFLKQHEKKSGSDIALKLKVSFNRLGHMTTSIDTIAPVPLTTLYPSSLSPPNASPHPHPASTPSQQQPSFTPSPLTGGALTLGPTDHLPTGNPPTNDRLPPTWNLKLDTAPTPTSPFTLLKTSTRDMYNDSRSRALPTNPSHPALVEVLLYNDVHELTEGSLTSLYLFRGGRWVTPPVGVPCGAFSSSTPRGSEKDGGADTVLDEGEIRMPFAGRWGHSVRSAKVGAGGQRGTSRRWALSKGFCMEEPVGVDTVVVGEGCWVSNGVRGFGWGRVVE